MLERKETRESSIMTDCEPILVLETVAEAKSSEGVDEIVCEQVTGICTCPVCGFLVKESRINQHLDSSCIIGRMPNPSIKASAPSIPLPLHPQFPMQTRRSSARAMVDTRTPRASKAYDTLKDKLLRDLLKEDGLRLGGDRKTMIKRHKQWVRMYNANLDSRNPKSDRTIRGELEDWEALHSKVSSNNMNKRNGDGAVIGDENGMLDHATKYATEFQELVQEIQDRKRRKKGVEDESILVGEEKVQSMMGASSELDRPLMSSQEFF
jgi:DNA repair protein Rad18